jgi:hypothetical protein
MRPELTIAQANDYENTEYDMLEGNRLEANLSKDSLYCPSSAWVSTIFTLAGVSCSAFSFCS